MQFKKITSFHLSTWLICLSIFFIPLQVKKLLFETSINPQGTFNQFTNYSIYLQNIFLYLAGIIWAYQILFKKKLPNLGQPKVKEMLYLMILFTSYGVLIATDKIAALSLFLNILNGLLLYLLIINHSQTDQQRRLWAQSFIAAALIQSVIAIIQYILQSSIGLTMFGETILYSGKTGLSKIDLLDHQIIRGYGTMPHPNLLGGFLAVSIILVTSFKKSFYKILLILILLAGLLTTFSRSAIIALLISLLLSEFAFKTQNLFKISTKKLLLVCLIILVVFASPLKLRFMPSISNSVEVAERIEQSSISLKMIAGNPLGIGLNQFTGQMQKFSIEKIHPWEYQPVHNVYLLAISELGLLSILAIGWKIRQFLLIYREKIANLISKSQKTIFQTTFKLAIFVLIIMFADHYFYTLPQGILIFGFFMAYLNICLENSQRKIKRINQP